MHVSNVCELFCIWYDQFCNSYNDAVATIRRAPGMEHQFQLVVTRAYEDEDQELLEDEDECEW